MMMNMTINMAKIITMKEKEVEINNQKLSIRKRIHQTNSKKTTIIIHKVVAETEDQLDILKGQDNMLKKVQANKTINKRLKLKKWKIVRWLKMLLRISMLTVRFLEMLEKMLRERMLSHLIILLYTKN